MVIICVKRKIMFLFQYIVQNYHEDPNSYDNEIKELETLREVQ